MPKVLNISGKHGQIPPGAVYVGRRESRVGLRRSKWANPFKPDKLHKKRDGTQDEVVAKYRAWLLGEAQFPDKPSPPPLAELAELHGKDLACWCAPARCHAEVLLELANQ